MTVDEIVDQFSVHRPKGQAKGTVARRSLKKKINQLIQEREKAARLRGTQDCIDFIMRNDESPFRSERAWFKIKPGRLLKYQAEIMKELSKEHAAPTSESKEQP